MNFQHKWNSPLGMLHLFSQKETLVGLYFPQHTPRPKHTGGKQDGHAFQEVMEQLQEFFAGERTQFDLPIAFSNGTLFQREVWNALRNIPYGATTSYGQIANDIGRPKAMRAIGAAVGKNPLSIVVPCHRVVGADGSLTGFAGGISRKKTLLELERGAVSAEA